MFRDNALLLCGKSAMLLGWRPCDFWHATPAELACILGVIAADTETPLARSNITELMEIFPDG